MAVESQHWIRMAHLKKLTVIYMLIAMLQGCSTAVAVVDTAASIVVYTGETIVNTIDAVTPDIVN